MTSASGTQRRSSGPTGAGLAFDLSVRIRRPAPEVFALLADIQDAEPLPRRATLRMVKDPPGPTGWNALARGGEDCPRMLAPQKRGRSRRRRTVASCTTGDAAAARLAALAACGYRPTAEAARCRATR